MRGDIELIGGSPVHPPPTRENPGDWKYKFNYDKTAVVTFGESLACHSKAMKQRNWHVGPTQIDERDEYTN